MGFGDFFGQIEELEDDDRGAEGLLEELIDAAEPFHGLVNFEKRIDEGEEHALGHEVVFNLIAGVKNEERENDGGENVHDRRSSNVGAHPAHIFAQELASGFAEAADFEALHAEGFHDAIAGDGFLKDMAQVGEADATGFRGTADFFAKAADGDDDQRDENRGAESEFPIDGEQDGDEGDEREYLAEEIGQEFGEGAADLLDVVNDRGHEAAGGIVLKEADGLLNQAAIDAIAKVHDAGVADVLNHCAAEKFGEGFDEKDGEQGEGEDGPDVTDGVREEGVEIDGVAVELDQGEGLRGGARVEDDVDYRDDHQGDEAFGEAEDGHQEYAGDETGEVGPHVSEQAPDFF